MDQAQIKAQFDAITIKAVEEWGALRRFVSAHPMTGMYSGMAVGFGLHMILSWFM